MWDVLFLEEAKSKLKRTVFTFDYLSVNPLFKKLAAEQSLKGTISMFAARLSIE